MLPPLPVYRFNIRFVADCCIMTRLVTRAQGGQFVRYARLFSWALASVCHVAASAWVGRCARRFPLSVAGPSFVPRSGGMRPRPKGTARVSFSAESAWQPLRPDSPLSIYLYHLSSHMINNTANSPVRIDKSGAQITAVTGDIGDGTGNYSKRSDRTLGPIV